MRHRIEIHFPDPKMIGAIKYAAEIWDLSLSDFVRSVLAEHFKTLDNNPAFKVRLQRHLDESQVQS